MDIYALLSLIASAICVPLGLSVYFFNRKSTINKLFMLTMFANAYWAFCQFMLLQANSYADAVFWARAFAFWPFLVALLLHFTLVFTESEVLESKLVYVAIYFPAVLFSLIDLTTNWISLPPAWNVLGYKTVASNSAVSILDGVWGAVIGLLIVILYATYFRRVVDKTKKQQTKFIAIAFALPICLSIATDSLFPFVGISFPGLGAISGSIMSFFVLYAMWRYELFGFSPEIAVENVFSTMVDAVLLTDLDGKIVKVNKSLLQILACSENEVLCKKINDVVQEANIVNRDKVAPKIEADLRGKGEVRGCEITFYSKSGEEKIGLLSCSVIHDNSGNEVGVAFVVHDVSEHKAMEKRLLKAERLASIGELAGLLGHDLRNPLNAIGVASYYLKTKYANMLDSKDAVMLQSIEKSIDCSNKIINDLIDYSSEINLELEIATPKSLINSAIALVDLPESIHVIDETLKTPEFPVDVVRMRQSFANVIRNALDAMPKGGDLTVKSEVTGEMVVFSFQDTGCGMAPEVLSKIWAPLFTTKAKGMGFGLAICRRVVETHDGRISAESQLNGGTTVRIELPLKLK